MVTWVQSNLNFWYLWLPQRCHFRVRATERQAMLLAVWEDLRSVGKLVVLAL